MAYKAVIFNGTLKIHTEFTSKHGGQACQREFQAQVGGARIFDMSALALQLAIVGP